MEQHFNTKVHEIASCLDGLVIESEPLGLQYGELGRAFFFLHYARQFSDSYYEKQGLQIISGIFNKLNNLDFKPTLSLDRELAEIGCALEYLKYFDMVSIETNDILTDFDTLLYDYMSGHLQEFNYDPDNGALVVGYYYLMRLRSCNSVKPYLEKLVDSLANFAVSASNNSVYWISKFNTENKIFLSLPHGISTIIIFLQALQSHNIRVDFCQELIHKSLNYLTSNILDYSSTGYYFPSYVGSNTKTRLGWCYGDLGIAYALFRGGQAINSEVHQQLAIDIFTVSTQRRDLANNSVEDAGLTYGTTGIAIMYQKMHQLTGIPLFASTAAFWFEQTIHFATHINSFAGYQAAYNHSRSYNNTSYSEGIAGIGLALLSGLDAQNINFSEFMYLL